jgi:hypothetical protein
MLADLSKGTFAARGLAVSGLRLYCSLLFGWRRCGFGQEMGDWYLETYSLEALSLGEVISVSLREFCSKKECSGFA